MRPVRDDGPRSARIVVVGEAPGRVEQAQGRPFLGPAGKLLTRWLEGAGLRRQDCYLTNVLNVQPPGNDLGKVSDADISLGVQRVRAILGVLDDPVVVVPVGNLALRAVLDLQGITKRRGYIYPYTDQRGRTIKCIPTIHPAATFREGGSAETDEGKKGRRTWKIRCQLDWKRIAAESKFPELALPVREHYIRPTWDDLMWLREQIRRCSREDVVALDIETRRARIEEIVGYAKNGAPKKKRTWGRRFVSCIGFSTDPSWSMTIPTTREFWGSEKRLQSVIDVIREILHSDVEKATQKGHYDFWWLAQAPFHAWPRRWRWDTLAMHHVEDPCESHSLEFQASIFLRTQYWKDEDDEIQDWEQSQRYNGKDCTATRELVDAHRALHEERGLGSQYENHYRRLFTPLLDCMVRGLPVNGERRSARGTALEDACTRLRARLTTLAGDDLYGKTDLSPLKLQKFLYEKLRLPVQTKFDPKKKTRRPTANEVAVRRLTIKHPQVMREAGPLILDVKRTQKMQEFYTDKLVGSDGRAHCTYGWAETMRLTCREAPDDTGRNQQNFDRECREHLIPDPGCLAMKIDMSQAESRVIFAETGDARLIELARLPPWEHDQHAYTSELISRTLGREVSRHLGKMTNHAAQRDMKGKTFSEHLLKETGEVFTPEECQELLDAYFTGNYAPIRTEYFRRIRHQIINDKRLSAACGFTMWFNEERVSDDLFRRGYSFPPQHAVACHLNTHGMVPMYAYLRGMQSRIVVNEHDALWLSVHPKELWDVWAAGRQFLEAAPVRCTNGVELTIPVGGEVGVNFAFRDEEMVEFKRPPSRGDFWDLVAPLL